MSAKIIGIGYALPDTVVTNDDLSKIMDTNDEWITSRTGIRQRYFSTDENTSDLATRAAQKAIENSTIDPQTIDLIIVATFTPDHFTPSVASIIQKNLNLTHNLMAFDVNGACSGFVIALEVALGLLKTHQRCLLIGAEVISKILDLKDRSTSILFGDGAAAILLEYDESRKITIINRAYPDTNDVLIAPSVALLNHDLNRQVLSMKGSEVYRFAVKVVSDVILEMNDQRVDLIILHQANQRIITHVAKTLNIPIEKFYMNLDQVGNTSAASIPLAIAMAMEEKKLKKSDRILCIGFGAGLTMGAAILEI